MALNTLITLPKLDKKFAASVPVILRALISVLLVFRYGEECQALRVFAMSFLNVPQSRAELARALQYSVAQVENVFPALRDAELLVMA